MADGAGQPAGDAWGDDIPPERQAELEQRLQAWEMEVDHGKRKGPFDTGSVTERYKLTGADVFWLAARTLAETNKAQAVAGQMERLRQAQDKGPLSIVLFLGSLHLEGANLGAAHLEGAHLKWAHLEGAYLVAAHLRGANLFEAHLERADLSWAHLEHAALGWAHLERAGLGAAHLEHADLSGAHLEGAYLHEAHLEGANLSRAHLEGHVYADSADDQADYRRGRQRVSAYPRVLAPAVMCGVVLDGATLLNNVTLGTPGNGSGQGYVQVADVRWGGANLAVVKDWPPNMVLGDEREAWGWRPPKREIAKPASKGDKQPNRKERAEARRLQEKKWQDAVAKAAHERLELFRAAVRANRQLATALREQGMNEEADRFAYRAQVCQRRVLRLQRQYPRVVGSWLLDAIAGYGYRPSRSILAYIFIILLFTGLYLLNGQFAAPHLRWDEALVLSISSFHGRGFFTTGISLGDTLARLAAAEAIIGLLIEITFIATFTQRFFAK